jgi:hypothetical protein
VNEVAPKLVPNVVIGNPPQQVFYRLAMTFLTLHCTTSGCEDEQLVLSLYSL